MQDWEGLAHLAEHVTLASAAGVRLAEWVDEREGEVRGFQKQETNQRESERRHTKSDQRLGHWTDGGGGLGGRRPDGDGEDSLQSTGKRRAVRATR